MAKKQKRSRKNKVAEKNEALPADVVEVSNVDSLSNQQFAFLIAFVLGLATYLAFFLFSTTEFGDRFWTYLLLALNPEIYRAYWTGSPEGQFYLLDRWPIVLGVLFQLGLAVGIGRFLLGKLAWRSPIWLEQIVVEIGLGLAVISSYTVGVGLIQVLSLKQLLIIPILILAAIGWMKRPPEPGSVHSKKDESEKDWSRWVWLLSLPFMFFVTLASMIPPWEFDVREYHFQVPKEWFELGGVRFLEHNIYGNMPLGTEMHALFAMLFCFGEQDWWWGVLIGKTVSGLFVVLNAGALFLPW